MSQRPIRLGEYLLCQFPDSLCDSRQFGGTAFCAPHLDEMRDRSLADLDEEHEPPFEMCAGDDEDATGHSRPEESPSYRDAMHDAGRGHLLP